MVKEAFAYFDGQRGYLITVADDRTVREIMTTVASPGNPFIFSCQVWPPSWLLKMPAPLEEA